MGDVAQRLELAVEQDRLAQDQLVRVGRRLVEEVELGAEARSEAHHDLLADRVDRRVGDLREELLEVGEQRRGLVGEHGQREVVAHRADRLGPVARHRGEQHPQVLLGVAEGALAGVQRLVGDRYRLGGGQVVEQYRVAHEPLPVGPAGGDGALDLAVLDDAAPGEVDKEQLAGLQAAQTPDTLGRDIEQPALRAEHDEPVDGLHPAPRPQAVAVERGADQAPVGERDRGGAVPGLHQTGVEGVEVAQLLRQVVAFAEGLGDHHHHRVRQRAPGEQQQLEHAVEGRGVRVPGLDDGQDLGEVGAEQLGLELGLAGAHPGDVAHHGVELPVVADHAVGVCQLPGGEGVGREARVHERQRAAGARVAQVGVEAAELVGDQHALVVEGARGGRGHVQARGGGVELADAADHEQLALEGVLVEVPGSIGPTLRTRASPHEQLPDRGTADAGGAPNVGGVHGHLAPAEHALTLGVDDTLEQLAQPRTLLRVERKETHQHPVAPGRR